MKTCYYLLGIKVLHLCRGAGVHLSGQEKHEPVSRPCQGTSARPHEKVFGGTDPEGFIPVLPVVPHLQNWENPEVEADGRTD